MLKNVSISKDAKKWPTDANFQAPPPPASTGCKVEMAGANAEEYCYQQFCRKELCLYGNRLYWFYF